MRYVKPKPEPALPVKPVAHSVEDAAKALGIGRTLAYRLIRDGQLLAVRCGRRTLVPVTECEAFIVRLAAGEVAYPKAG